MSSGTLWLSMSPFSFFSCLCSYIYLMSVSCLKTLCQLVVTEEERKPATPSNQAGQAVGRLAWTVLLAIDNEYVGRKEGGLRISLVAERRALGRKSKHLYIHESREKESVAWQACLPA